MPPSPQNPTCRWRPESSTKWSATRRRDVLRQTEAVFRRVPDDGFGSPEEAAVFAHENIYPISLKYDIEIGALIFGWQRRYRLEGPTPPSSGTKQITCRGRGAGRAVLRRPHVTSTARVGCEIALEVTEGSLLKRFHNPRELR